VLGKVTSSLLDNGHNSPLNGKQSLIPYISENTSNRLGKNDCMYYKPNTHIGKPSSSRVKKLQSGPYIERLAKSVSNSSEDYQDHKKRQSLILKSGFNQKGFTFLMEDTYFKADN
jgi:hypothetical protein